MFMRSSIKLLLETLSLETLVLTSEVSSKLTRCMEERKEEKRQLLCITCGNALSSETDTLKLIQRVISIL